MNWASTLKTCSAPAAALGRQHSPFRPRPAPRRSTARLSHTARAPPSRLPSPPRCTRLSASACASLAARLSRSRAAGSHASYGEKDGARSKGRPSCERGALTPRSLAEGASPRSTKSIVSSTLTGISRYWRRVRPAGRAANRCEQRASCSAIAEGAAHAAGSGASAPPTGAPHARARLEHRFEGPPAAAAGRPWRTRNPRPHACERRLGMRRQQRPRARARPDSASSPSLAAQRGHLRPELADRAACGGLDDGISASSTGDRCARRGAPRSAGACPPAAVRRWWSRGSRRGRRCLGDDLLDNIVRSEWPARRRFRLGELEQRVERESARLALRSLHSARCQSRARAPALHATAWHRALCGRSHERERAP